ncbi:MAG: Uma2 family endonuclease, partial [Aquificaceae bacterium]|nr:Uma2 family endonuclease [Aquificaceae bacterium]
PGFEHYKSQRNILRKLFETVLDTDRGEVIFAPFDLYLDERNAYQPDIMVLLKGSKAKITSKGVYGAPDIVVEVLSPSTAYYDLTEKKDAYERAGVKELWIVDPLRRSFEVYQNTEKGFMLLSKARERGKVRSELLGFEIELSGVFKGVEL